MQHESNHEKSRFEAVRKFFEARGYYIALILCIFAVGISGYLFVSGAVEEKNALEQPALSVATKADDPQSHTQRQTQPASAPAQDEAASGRTAEASASVTQDELVRQTAEKIRVWPLSGEQQRIYSVDALLFNETTNDWRTHDGVDLTAALGQPVLASCAGSVTAVYDDEYLGTTVVLSHEGGYTTHYSNLAAMPNVSAGDAVRAGDVIGAVGETALLEAGEEPHLHFAVCLGGAPVDPAQFIGES